MRLKGEASPASTGNPWPALPIILDSPLASRFTAVYRQLQPFWDNEAQNRLQQGRSPLQFANLFTVDSHAQNLAMIRNLQQSGRPTIVIAASGMCAGGRIVNYLKALLGDRRHNVLFVGCQAKGTPGQIIQQYGPRGGYVDLDGERIAIRAGIETLSGYSAHADQQGLLNFATRMRHWTREIRLVHGEEKAKRHRGRGAASTLPSQGKSAATDPVGASLLATWSTIDISRGTAASHPEQTGHAVIKERMRKENAIRGGGMSTHN